MREILKKHINMIEVDYREMTEGTYKIVLGAAGNYKIEFCNIIIDGIEQCELKVYYNNDIIFWLMEEKSITFNKVMEYIDNLNP